MLPSSSNSEFLTVEDAAELVGLSHWTLRVWIQKGKLAKYKSVGRVVVSRAELLALLEPKPALHALHGHTKGIHKKDP